MNCTPDPHRDKYVWLELWTSKQPSKLAHQSEDAINQLSIHIEQIKPLLLRSHLVPDVPNLYQDKITTKQKVFPRDQTFCFCNHSE